MNLPSCPRLFAWVLPFLTGFGALADPIRLHPDNPHYFLWRGRPTVLLTSGEHYGAVLNADFDYRRYLRSLSRAGMNNTRTFSGTYAEPQGAFNIARNTLAPAAGRLLTPWARSDQPGYAQGGNKFDLSRWDDGYFRRLRDFVGYADRRGVAVEFTLFCPMYEDKQWRLSPMHADNNVNGVGAIGRNDVHTLDRNGGLLAVQEALVRRVVTELNPFDNVLFEICNEPYFGGVTLAWQHHIAELIVATEQGLPKRHLITQNIANNQARVVDPHPAVSVLNFHYATPPDTVALNYGLRRVIGDNETGFRGTNNAPYRTEAWDFLLAGGGLFNHLDYSFTVGHEDGTFVVPATQPGAGNAQLRREFAILGRFLRGFDFLRMNPDNTVIRGGVPPGGTARALVEPGRAIAVYLRDTGSTGPWSARWTGFLEAPASGRYQLHTTSNDGIRLWIDDRQVIEDWTDHSEKVDSAEVTLEAGRRHALRVEFFYNGGQGVTKLAWTRPDGRKEPIPANAFRLPIGDAWGLRGEYFHGTDLRQPWGSRDDGTLNFTWGVQRPLAQGTAGGTTAAALEIEVPPGTWTATWIDTRTGRTVRRQPVEGGGVRPLSVPPFDLDIALALRRR